MGKFDLKDSFQEKQIDIKTEVGEEYEYHSKKMDDQEIYISLKFIVIMKI